MQHKDEEDSNKIIEEEFQRRYKTRNLFKPNAGPAYQISEIRARELKRRKIIRKPEVSKGNGSYRNHAAEESKKTDFTEPELPIIKPAPKSRRKKDEEIPLIDKKEVPELLEDKVKEIPLEVSEPYDQGDDIYRELLNYFHSNKLCGKDVIPVLEEDGNCILSTIGSAYGLSIIIQGRSRSGKSLILDKLSDILTSVYKLKVCSNKSLFGSSEKINENDFLYVAEYQAALDGNPAVKEAIKLITENKDATNDTNGNIQRLSGHLTVLTTGADENKKIQNMDVEVSGRFINMRTSSGAEKTKRICKYQDGLEMGVRKDIEFEKERYDRLKQHIMNVIDDKKTGFEDPFARAFAKYLPETQKSVYYRTLYKSLIKAGAKFDKPNRVMNDEKIIMNITDIYLVFELFHKNYCDNLRELSEQSYRSLVKSIADPNEIERLEEEHTKEVQEIESKRDVHLNFNDWQEIWNNAYDHMRKSHPNLLDKWVDLQSRDGQVIVHDPVRDKDVHLCDVYQKTDPEDDDIKYKLVAVEGDDANA